MTLNQAIVGCCYGHRVRPHVFLVLFALSYLVINASWNQGVGKTNHFARLSPVRTLVAGPPDDLVARKCGYKDDPIIFVQTLCINNGLERSDPGLTAVRSILAARAAGFSPNRRYIFHFLVDNYAGWLFSNNYTATMPHGKLLKYPDSLNLFQELWGDVFAHMESSDFIEFYIHAEDDAYAAVEDALGIGATRGFNHDGFKRCAPLRLTIPFLPALSNVSKAIFLDLDLVFLCDPQQVWRNQLSR